ncbi:BRCA1-associated RING domain protein 1 [Toxocara canis]|uniref:BRCA1-associated RING domain protein 1 n=1 Tax=Toxocara canis TaxID=6265 RepID=A0A0B2VVW1_TOXCA|nr:BRCA1-associated RING domain protein 1 [Toxocara canis]
MLPGTMKEAEHCLSRIRCNRCLTSDDNLQFLGNSCKHVFCWTCINEMSAGDSFVQCPLCALPIDIRRPLSATFVNQFFDHLLSFKRHLAELNMNHMSKDVLATLAEPDQPKRTAEGFCSSQCVQLGDGNLADEVLGSENGDHSQTRRVEEEDSTSQESSKVEAAIDEAIHRNDVATEGILQQYASLENRPVRDIRSPSSSITTSDIAVSETTDEPHLGSQSDFKLFSQFSQVTQNCDERKTTEMTQQIPVFKVPDEYVFFKNRPSATFAKGAVNLIDTATSSCDGSKFAENDAEPKSDTANNRKVNTRSRSILSHHKGQNVLINAAISGQPLLLIEALEVCII